MKIAFDRRQINQDFFKLIGKKKSSSHALSTVNSIAFTGRTAYQMKAFFCHLNMFQLKKLKKIQYVAKVCTKKIRNCRNFFAQIKLD